MLHLKEREILLFGPVSLLNALLEEKSKRIFSLEIDQFICFLWLKKNLFVLLFFYFKIFFAVWDTVIYPWKSLLLLQCWVAAPLLLWECLLVREWLEERYERVWVLSLLLPSEQNIRALLTSEAR